jgi:Rod binding domain-containing protein
VKTDSVKQIDASLTAGQTVTARQSGKRQMDSKAAESFESFLIFTILKEMGKTASVTKKSWTEDTHMSVFYEKVADALAKKGVGIKEMLSKYSGESNSKALKPHPTDGRLGSGGTNPPLPPGAKVFPGDGENK